MFERLDFYINGAWVPAANGAKHAVINPSTEGVLGHIAMGSTDDADRAVAAAKVAFPSYAAASIKDRIELLENIIAAYKASAEDLAQVVSQEMGAPMGLATKLHVPVAMAHFYEAIRLLKEFPFEETLDETDLLHEPIGVCGLITPWNWPLNQVTCKLAPALAAGCTMVLKPSELSPFSAMLLMDVLDKAGVPAGVVNLVNGDGPTVGARLASHPDIDLVSITGSTRAGAAVAEAAAPTIKRVSQELGGKSANIILPSADLKAAVKGGAISCFTNSGQSCNAPTRMLVHADQYEEALEIAAAVAASMTVGPADDPSNKLGPVVSKTQYDKIQALIEAGVSEGARLVAGGAGRPEHLERGYFVQPTVFGDVVPSMTIAREEIFGPVLSILKYETVDEAVEIANDSPYGLSGYVAAATTEEAVAVARRLRTGMVHINGANPDFRAPFGGYRQSGNGREWGVHGLKEFLEVKAVFGANIAAE